MNPFDTMFKRGEAVERTAEETAALTAEAAKAKRLAGLELGRLQGRFSAKRGANPEPVRPKVRIPAPPPAGGVVAAPRFAPRMSGQYVPSTQMREALERARADQPAIKSIAAKEDPC